MGFIGQHHAGLVVPDLDRAVDFYGELAGYRKVRESRWDADSPFNQIVGLEGSAARFCMLEGPTGYLELFEYEQPTSREEPASFTANELGLRHLCFEVDDVPAMLARVVKLGGSAINEPVTNEFGITCTYCRDPFGNLLELIAPSAEGPFPSLRR